MAINSTINLSQKQQEKVLNDFVLVVDDEPANLSMLKDVLSSIDLKVRIAINGEKALEILHRQVPELILLDISMPGIDGFETCQRIKSDIRTEAIPVIFTTAMSETSQKVRGFSVGAVDYITKPFQVEELLARVKVQLEVKRLNTILRTKNKQLEQEVLSRTLAEERLKQTNYKLNNNIQKLKETQVQLIQSERMSSLGYLVAGVAHEINNPANFIQGNLDPAKAYAEDLMSLAQLYQQQYTDDNPVIKTALDDLDIPFVSEDFPRLLNSIQVGTDRIKKVVDSLKKFACLNEASFKKFDLNEGIDNTLFLLSHRLNLKSGQTVSGQAISDQAMSDQTTVEVMREYGDIPQFECHPDQLNQVFMNIISNGIDALEKTLLSSEEGANWVPRLEIKTYFESGEVWVIIKDNGEGISENIQQKVFEPFFTTKPTGQGTGLGLTISRQIIAEKHGGRLEVNSAPSQGTAFTICLPI